MAKKSKEVFNWLIQDIRVNPSMNLSSNEGQAFINVIHARIGQEEVVLNLFFITHENFDPTIGLN
jgi:hypothetical protein